MKKKILLVGIIAMLIISLFVLTGCGENENTTTEKEIVTSAEETNTNSENAKSNNDHVYFEIKTFEGLQFSGMQLVKKDNYNAYELYGTITNITSSVIPSQDLKITFVDKDGKELATSNSFKVKELQPNGTYYLDMMAKMDLANTYDYKVTK